MKVYVVEWDNDAKYSEDSMSGIAGVFASRESAEKYIQEQRALYPKQVERYKELEKLYIADELTEDEDKEWMELEYILWSVYDRERGFRYDITSYELQE